MKRSAIGPTLLALALALTATAGAPVAATTAAGTPASPHAPPAPMAPTSRQAGVPGKLVDINRASRKDLMTLPGIGAAEAARIIANRPYLTKTELVSKQVLLVGPFLALRHQVVAMQVIEPAAGWKAPPASAAAATGASKAP